MNINSKETGFQRVKDIQISDNLRTRIKTHTRIDDIFGTGIVPGSCITITGTPGSGKCHAGDQILEIFANDDVIEDIKRFLSTKTPG